MRARRIKARDTFRPRMIRAVAEILRHGEPSKFALEAHCRHSIRTHLCLEGVLWADADQRAASIVTAALDRIGAVRPTWWEGQLDYTGNVDLERQRCIRCGAEIPEERGKDRVVKYCSDACLHASHRARRQLLGKQTREEWLKKFAEETQRAREAKAFTCLHCERRFVAERLSQRFCSPACRYEYQRLETARRHERAQARIPDATCEVCLSIFRPKRRGSTLCSMKCVGKRAQRIRWGHPVADAPAPPAGEEPIRRAAE